MRKALAIAALALSVGMAGTPAQAQTYVVNGRAASAAEVKHLVSHGIPAGQWAVTGFAITAAGNGRDAPRPARLGRKCWYVLDVQLCD
jgi:hypothetical protein